MASLGSRGLQILLLLTGISLVQGVEVCKVADLSLVTQTGEFFIAVTFTGLGLSTIIFVLMFIKASNDKRAFFLITSFCCGVATLCYYAMLSGQGWLVTPSCRQMFYVRYVDWFITTPLLIMDIALIVGADWTILSALVGADMMMIFAGYMSAISSGHTKWIWFVFSCFCLVPVFYTILHTFKTMVERSHPAVGELYIKCSWILVISWCCYPVVFIFSDGTGDWNPNFESMMYGVLDLMAKSVFGFVLLLSHEALDRASNLPRFASIHGGSASMTAYGTQMEPQQTSSENYNVV